MSGRLKKVPAEISELLVHKLHVNPVWLMEDAGPMYKTDVAFARIRKATDIAVEVALRYTSVSHGLLMEMQTAAFEENLSGEELIARFQDRLPQSNLNENELVLLDNYRAADEEDRHAIDRMAALAAQSSKGKK